MPAESGAETFSGEVTRYSPTQGQPLFPAGNLNVFKQYVLAVDESKRIGKQVSIDFLFDSVEFGGEVSAGVKAAIGLEIGLCFGGTADYDLAFRPTITVPDRYPSEFPIRLVVDEGLLPDSHFTTSFPPLGRAYADLIFDFNAYLRTKACVFGCVYPPQANFSFDTCDPTISAILGYPMFKESVRCDQSITAEAYCAVELASFNRDGVNNTFRMLNVTANNRFEFIGKPYLEKGLFSSVGQSSVFTVDPTFDTLNVSDVHRLSDGKQVKVSTTGTLPVPLTAGKIYYVNKLKADGLTGISFQLATRSGGSGINITSEGSGTHQVSIVETDKPDSPALGKYGTISINSPTVGTDSRMAAINGKEKTFTVMPSPSNQVVIPEGPGYRNGNKVRISSSGKLPGGLSRGCVYTVVNATPNGLAFQLATRLSGPLVEISDAGTGPHQVALNAEFNTAEGLRSSGAEDMISISLDAASLVSDLLFPPSFPPLKFGPESLGPLSVDYTLASLSLGPAVQLKTDFQMTWDLIVTEITFREPLTMNPRPVIIEGKEVVKFTESFPGRVVHLTNKGPYALPSIVLKTQDPPLPVTVTITYILKPKLKTRVSAPFLGRVQYEALGAGASISHVGSLRFGPLLKGEHVFKAGEFTVFDGNPTALEDVNPRSEYASLQDLARYDLRLIDTDVDLVPGSGCALVILYKVADIILLRVFDVVGNMVVNAPAANLLTPSALSALESQLSQWPVTNLSEELSGSILRNATSFAALTPGVISFDLKAAGPPSFKWDPFPADSLSTYNWVEKLGDPQNPATRWLELFTSLKTSYPGEFGSGSDATIATNPYPSLYNSLMLASLKVQTGSRLDVISTSGTQAGLKVFGGVIENNGLISLSGQDNSSNSSFLWLEKPDAMLTGSGTMVLNDDAQLKGYSGAEPFTFTNYNLILGAGGAMDRYGSSSSGSTIVNMGQISARGFQGLLLTSAEHYLNQGLLEVRANMDLSVYGEVLENRAGGRIVADGAASNLYFSFREVEQAGLIQANAGGFISIYPWIADKAEWNAGQTHAGWQPGNPLPEDGGVLLASGTGSMVEFNQVNLRGGFLAMADGGKILSMDASFDGTVFQIGTFDPSGLDPSSGELVLAGTDAILTGVHLDNYGTLSIDGSVDFRETAHFANNGKIMIPEGKTLLIRELRDQTADPVASEEARRHPGTANATSDTLLGGIWEISGTLLIEGAALVELGANAARANTTSGSSFETDGAPDLVLKVENDESRVLSFGNPAHVILRGPNWSFPAIETLQVNGGVMELHEGADFPSGGGATAGDFVNRGELILTQDSQFQVGGRYIQSGASSSIEVFPGGSLFSSVNEFQIIGGTVYLDPDGGFLNFTGSSFTSGTTIRVESPMLFTDEIDYSTGEPFYVQEPVVINVVGQISSIASGVDLTIHGSAVQFPALTNYLSSNAGRFTVSGDGIDNAPQMTFGLGSFGTFNNTGEVNILGQGTKFNTGTYTQSGANAVTVVGVGAILTANSTLEIFNGGLLIEITSRPGAGEFGQVRASEANFNNLLVVDFSGDVAASMPDVGDTWPIMPANSHSKITGDTVTFLYEGGPLPAGWLPEGSHLEVVRLNPIEDLVDGGILSGLGIRVVPDGGFIEYDSWAMSRGFDRSPASFLSDPMQDLNGDGIENVYEFLFGPVNGDGNFPGRQSQRLVVEDGRNYIEFSYDRPRGTSAAYTHYYSQDLKNWFRASMIIADIVSYGSGSSLERVFVESTFPIPDGSVFFRVKGELYGVDHGLLGDNPIIYSGGSPLNNLTPEDLIQDGVTPGYLVVPGRALYFRTTGTTTGSVYAYITEADERQHIYQDFSALGAAAVHAGALADQETGLLKVIFVEPPPAIQLEDPFSHTWRENNVTAYPFNFPRRENETYSYRIERVSGESDNQ